MLTLNEGANVAFQAVDEYELYNELVTDVFQGKEKIVRIEKNHDSTVLGCRVTYHEEDFDEYVMNKKLSIFISERK